MNNKILMKKSYLIAILFAFIIPAVIISLLPGDIFEQVHPRFFIQKLGVFAIFILIIMESAYAYKSNIILKYLPGRAQLSNGRVRSLSKTLFIVIIFISTIICLSMVYDVIVTVGGHEIYTSNMH